MLPGHPALFSAVALETDAMDKSSSSICTGVLVAPDLILTAAHCLWRQKITALVFGGSTDRKHSPQVRAPLAMRAHPKYADALSPEFDIAWVSFKGPLPPGFVPVPLLAGEGLLLKGTPLVLAGYGDTGTARNDAGVLRATTSVLDGVIPNAPVPYRSMVFVGPTPGRGSCHGDSGGPAYVNLGGGWKLVGVSRGSPGERCEAGRSIFTFTGHYVDWIKATSFRRF